MARGAIGGFLGVRLARAGAALSVMARGKTLEALRAGGWTLLHGAQFTVATVNAVADPRELGEQDIVILAVKACSVPSVAPMLAPLLGPRTMLVPALNGVPWWFTDGPAQMPLRALQSVDPGGLIAAGIPIGKVVGAVVYPACSSPAPAVARHHSGSRIVFGEPAAPAGVAPSQRVLELVRLHREAGFDAEASADIRTELWKKLLGNACFNPVSLLTGSATDLMIDDPGVYALFAAMMSETLAIGRAMGVDAAIDPVDRIAITRKLGNVKTSMLQDSEAARVVEIDAILGAVIELADQLGVDAPHLRAVYALARMRAKTFGLLQN